MEQQALTQGFRIDDIVVEPSNATLTLADGTTSQLEPKVMAVLLCLASAGNRTVTRSELLDAAWNGQVAADELLTRAISEIRRALHDDPRDPKFIRTVPKRGYRLIGNVAPMSNDLHARPTQVSFFRRSVFAPIVVTLAAALLFVAYTFNSSMKPAAMTAATTATMGRSTPLTSTQGYEWSPALSSDGRYAAFVSSPPGNFKVGDIHIVEVGTAMPFPLTRNPQAGNRAPAWSPDGTRIAFVRSGEGGKRELVSKSVLQGVETRLATADIFWGHDWSPDGENLAVAIGTSGDKRARIYQLSVTDGSLIELITPDSANGDHQPRYSPDGRTLAFLRWNEFGTSADLCLKPLGDASVNCITPADKQWPIRDYAWSPNGESLIVSVDGLVRLPVSGAKPEPLPFGKDAYNVATARGANRLVYESFTEDSNLWRMPGPSSTADGEPERLIASTRAELLPRYSPDGSKIAFVSGRSGGWEVWVAGADGSQARRLTGWGFAAFPDWSPDGRLITFSSGRYAVGRGEQSPDDVGSDIDEAFSVEASGGVPRMISDGESGAKSPSWSDDGRYVFFTRGTNACGSEELWRRQLDSGEESRLTDCAWRPMAGGDGRVYFYNKAARGISSVSTDGADERLELRIDASCEPLANAWTVWNSRLVYVDCQDRGIKMLDLATRSTEELAPPLTQEQLFDYSSLDVSPDGQWIVYSRVDRGASDLIMVEPFQ